ncbi:VP3 [Rotavirus D chicken/05V0049/DEU/2005]|uniref:VP3 n=1 Tax=Rotavirus D chicken/05V0049/DEU/2005 TaxID=884200 RepID=E2EBU2_9REOV|nr:VP3 [Rotavirus D chicken/05V0049/DEU/2005]ADN06426.1 VP3 [Rotavirus D chicken/05V0049/DEU/2005]
MRLVVCSDEQSKTPLVNATLYRYRSNVHPAENAFLACNQIAEIILVINCSNFDKFSENVRSNGICCVDTRGNDDLFKSVVSGNCLFNENEVITIDYGYYRYKTLRTMFTYIFSFPKTEFKWESVPPSELCNDDDILTNYLYRSDKSVKFEEFIQQKILERLSFALRHEKYESRLLRTKVYNLYKNEKPIVIGPRNESMFELLSLNFTYYSANEFTVKDLSSLQSSRFREITLNEFDVGQYKNMLNFLSLYYYHVNHYGLPNRIVIIGSYPSKWLILLRNSGLNCEIILYDVKLDDSQKDIREFVFRNKFYTFDDSYTDIIDNSIVYLDARIEYSRDSEIDRRKKIELDTKIYFEWCDRLVRHFNKVTIMCKYTAMNGNLYKNIKLVNHIRTSIRSEVYLLFNIDDVSSEKVYIDKGKIYSFIQNHITDNVFIGKTFKVTKINKSTRPVVALYSLSNTLNDRKLCLSYINTTRRGILTYRARNNFTNEDLISYDKFKDYSCLRTELKSSDNSIVTSLSGALGVFGCQTTFNDKADGNVHFHVIKGIERTNIDKYALHLQISRRSQFLRFTETATSLSGYLFRDLASEGFSNDLSETDSNNAASGHVYNALIYFRYNWRFDLIYWMEKHINSNQIQSVGTNYYKHSIREIVNAINAAKKYAELQNDETLINYINTLIQLYPTNLLRR